MWKISHFVIWMREIFLFFEQETLKFNIFFFFKLEKKNLIVEEKKINTKAHNLHLFVRNFPIFNIYTYKVQKKKKLFKSSHFQNWIHAKKKRAHKLQVNGFLIITQNTNKQMFC